MFQAIKRLLTQNFSKHTIFVLIVFLFYSISRLFPILHYGDRAFGYDTGIYRFTINAYWEKFGEAGLPPMSFSWFTNFFKLIGFSTDMIMFGVYFATACAIFWLLYFVIKKYFDKRTALWAVFLFSISIVQFEFYHWYYYRSFVATALLLLSILLFSRHSYFSILPLILAVCFHPLAALPIVLTASTMIFLDKTKRRYWLITLAVTALGSVVMNWRAFYEHFIFLRDNQWLAGHDQSGATESTGQFIALPFFYKAVILYVVFSIIGLWKNYKNTKFFTLIGLFSILGIICRIMFYRRLYVWIDLILIIYASIFLTDLSKRYYDKKIWQIALWVFCLASLINISRYIYHKQPLINEGEFTAIMNTKALQKSEYVITFSNKYSPWLYGYTDKKIIAPGMFEHNKWNYAEWQVFWYGRDREKIIELLNRYNTPLYLFLNEYDVYWLSNFSNKPIFKKVDNHWYLFGE